MNFSDLVENVDSIDHTSKVSLVFEKFKTGRDILVVVDENSEPRGVLREADLKKYVYASFGREIIRNKPVALFAVGCETIPHDFDTELVLGKVESEFPHDGFIVTREGRYEGMLKKDAVLKIYELNRKSNEQQIMQLQRIESLGTLAGGIAHELNNMLMPIIGNAELGLEEAPEGSLGRRAFERIIAAAERSSEIVNQILIFSRPDLSEKSLVHPTSVVREVIGFIGASLPSTITINPEFSAERGIVLADTTQLHQVVLNLCTNAAHAMKNSGVLTLRVGEVTIDSTYKLAHEEALEGEFMRVSVIDTGCGMSDEVRKRMFEPFYTTKEVGQGTGLGLSVVLSIIKGHGGFLTVESEPGVGSTFSFHLPKVGEGEIVPTEDEEKELYGSARLLYVDDEMPILSVASEYLSRLGYTVVTSTDPRRALDMFRAAPDIFDLVITDQTMPEMTGDELIRSLRATRENLPIILCSGNAALTLGPLLGKTGANVLVQKPVGLAELAAIVAQTMKNPGISTQCPYLEGFVEGNANGADSGNRRRIDD